jgi:transposase
MANQARDITITPAAHATLKRLVRASSTPAGLSRRARAVLLMGEGVSGREIAMRTGYTPVQISRIRARFADAGVEGLADRARSGRPPALTAAKRARLLALTLKAPPKGLSQWSTRELAARVDVSATTVHRLWRAHALQPHRTQTFKGTTDPTAEAKIHDVVGLYLSPPANAVVLSVDEKTQIQALERTQPRLPLRAGLPARHTHD